MDAGEYYIGNLSTVLDYADEFGEESSHRQRQIDHMHSEGKFVLTNGREIVIFRLPNGDGLYPDHQGRTYHINDAGFIGLTLRKGLVDEYVGIEEFEELISIGGYIINFNETFECFSTTLKHTKARGGKVAFVHFGMEVDINTDLQVDPPEKTQDSFHLQLKSGSGYHETAIRAIKKTKCVDLGLIQYPDFKPIFFGYWQ
ncbi:hypothetical protein T484DRAFT_1755749 [Baffinella frigidus]|nr:hypothetical protein T484DRAFT_1755749 [Cryptophyta sp. CCMP2293]